jgi:hypothetical protein
MIDINPDRLLMHLHDCKEEDIISGCRVFATAVDELISARSNVE